MRAQELATNSADTFDRVTRLGDLLPGVLARYGLALPVPEASGTEHRATVSMHRDTGLRHHESRPQAGLLRRPA